jgi:hypothetical protein
MISFGENARLREELREARAEIRRLTSAIIAMKPAGYAADAGAYSAPGNEADDAADYTDELDAQIREAIAHVADDELDADELEAYARTELMAGKKTSDVAHAILEGLDPIAFMRE